MRFLIPIVITFTLVLTFSFSAISANELIRLTTGEWPPYISKDLKNNGVVLQIITEAFASQNINVEFEFFKQWKGAYGRAKNGNFDGTAVWGRKEERARYFLYSEAIITGQQVFFYLKKRPFTWQSINDLKGFYIGGVHQYTYGPDFDKAEAEGTIIVERVKNEYLNFTKLLKGRIDIFPVNLDAGYSLLNKNFSKKEIEQLTYNPKPIARWTYHLLLTKKISRNHKMLKHFNAGIAILKSTNRLEDLMSSFRRGEYNQ